MSAILGRLKKNYKHLKKWASKNNIEAYRIYDKDIPDYPYIIDIYKDCAVIWHRLKDIDQDPKKNDHKTELIDSLIELGFDRENQFHKERMRQKGNTQYVKVNAIEEKMIIKEGPLQFVVNLSDFLDTGLFLDHRPLRTKLTGLDEGMSLLNLFSYTCSLGVAAAFSGVKTTNVDLSAKYLDWGRSNYKINDIDSNQHVFIAADILEFIKTHTYTYDVILLDPPTFSNSKKMEQDWDVQKDHGWMIRKVAKCLNPGGFILFSNNKRGFKINVEELEDFDIEDLQGSSIPDDFRDKKIHQSFMITRKA
ncbi:MAG: 23S rRNA (cytosine1962-C5)-methyltransferase/23S rRNA (guanine2445-N2)-methyltransferase [Bacteriovoracaceae bacterium]|jgi:23S rRNA (cytosine1962-C5)-methyltransferase/23S rRNA (guanine2445-N2)-methyltransferase / 23S rRNA (guanine2069-N7)-methyltransferase